jgi:DNA polymerase III epsilon subunit family exonuclease
VAIEFLEFVRGAELLIHNAEFDLGFLDNELSLLGEGYGRLRDHCAVVDTLGLARERFPGQRNSLDALCRRLGVDNAHRTLHGALLDAELLADVYLAMTAGQWRPRLSLALGDRACDRRRCYARSRGHVAGIAAVRQRGRVRSATRRGWRRSRRSRRGSAGLPPKRRDRPEPGLSAAPNTTEPK